MRSRSRRSRPFGGRIILMASRALARVATSGDDYRKVYGRVLSQVKEPVIIHWLGDMFDPALTGYWGTKNLDAAMDVAVEIINAHAGKVDGVKISLLDKDKEIAMRRRLAKGVRMYTGDDFNYAELIAGDAQGYSDALLGIFDAIAPAAAAALVALAEGRRRDLPRHSRADGAAVAAYLQGADALLQDRRGVHGLSQRPSGSLHHGRRAGEHALDAASRRDFPACRCGGPAARSGACDRAHADGAFRCGWRISSLPACRAWDRDATVMRDLSKDHRWLSLNTATVRKQADFVGIVEACAKRGIRAVSPWRDQVAHVGLERAVKAVRDAGLEAVGLLPRRHVHERCRAPAGDARRQPPRHRRGGGARRALPGAGGRRPAAIFTAGLAAEQGYPRRACAGAGCDRRSCCEHTRRAPACRSRSSRCIRCMPPTAPA